MFVNVIITEIYILNFYSYLCVVKESKDDNISLAPCTIIKRMYQYVSITWILYTYFIQNFNNCLYWFYILYIISRHIIALYIILYLLFCGICKYTLTFLSHSNFNIKNSKFYCSWRSIKWHYLLCYNRLFKLKNV